MTKTNDLRLRLGLIGGQVEHQRPLNTSVIGANMRVFGCVYSTSVVSVAGTVLGSVSADDQVIVTKSGRVEGGVEAREVILNGEVRGPVDARERLEIQASAVVHGDLHAPRLRLLEGAVVDGDVSIAESSMECQSGAASGSAPQAPGVRGGDGSSGDAAVLERDGTAPERRAWVKPMSIVPGGMIALVVGWLISPSPSPGPAPSNPTTPVEAAVEPQISLFRASRTSITLGDEVTLIWNTSLADSVHLLPDEGPVAASGSTALSPEQDTEYVLVAYGPGGEARDPIQITVAVQLDAPTIEEFSADRTTVTKGDEVTLTWNTSNADRVELEPGGPVALSGDTNVSPGATVNYALVASGPGGETRQSVRISVAAPVPDPPIASLTAQPNTIERGGASTLTWSTTNATSVRLEPGVGPVAASGSRRVTPTGDQTYQLVVTGTGGTIEREVGVTVTALENPTPPPGADDPLNRPSWIERLEPSELCSDDDPVTAVPNFEDGNLWLAIRAALSINGAVELTCGLAPGLTDLTAQNAGIESLVGIQNLTGLMTLYLNGNSITEISALSGLTGLVDLRLDGNANLTDIQPLLDNTGFGAGDLVDLRDTSVSCTDVASLGAKGVTVVSDCP